MSCLGVSFINEVPTIPPITTEIPIVCRVNYPPPFSIPEIPMPPCVDGYELTTKSGEFGIRVNGGSVQALSIAPKECSWEFGGLIELTIPEASEITAIQDELSAINTAASGASSGLGGAGGHPYQISAQITSVSGSGIWSGLSVTVLGGKYKTDGQPDFLIVDSGDFPTVAVSAAYTPGNVNNLCFLRVPLKQSTPVDGVKATDGNYYEADAAAPTNAVVLLTNTEYPVFPFVTADGADYITYVKIGSCDVSSVLVEPGKYYNTVSVNQIVSEDIVISSGDIITNVDDYAFKLYTAGTDVYVRAGTVNALSVTGTDTAIAATDGLKLWIDATVNEDGIATAAEIGSGTDYPEDSETHGYQPLGTLSVAGVEITLPPYIVRGGLRHQMCAGQHLFGGVSA